MILRININKKEKSHMKDHTITIMYNNNYLILMWRQCQEMYYISVVLITDVIDPSIVFLANTL